MGGGRCAASFHLVDHDKTIFAGGAIRDPSLHGKIITVGFRGGGPGEVNGGAISSCREGCQSHRHNTAYGEERWFIQRPGAGLIFCPHIKIMTTCRQTANGQGGVECKIIEGGNGNRSATSGTGVGVKEIFSRCDGRLDKEFSGLIKGPSAAGSPGADIKVVTNSR